MEFSVNLPPDIGHTLITFSARRNLAIPDVIHRAVVEYMLDVESGLLSPPRPVCASLLGRNLPGRNRDRKTR